MGDWQEAAMSGKDLTFAVDASLGRLAKHLRLLGFDTEYQRGGDAEAFFRLSATDRIALTRIRRLHGRLPQRKWYLIRADDPDKQVRAVVRAFAIGTDDLRPFSRCTRCNRPVEPLAKEAVRGRVPEYVWQTQAHFSACPRCGRVFWPGSHTQRYQRKINYWFKRS
jgi:uncharacterized protein with PIN domain